MDHAEFRRRAHELVDWMADYLDRIESFPVRSPVAPGDVLMQLPARAPERAEPFDAIVADFERVILPGITHWQHPSFFAFYPANSSPPSILGEMLTATLAAQCMVWRTSPAAAELEERVMEWLRELLGLPREWTGVIQDTASTATLCALLTARERASGGAVNESGLREAPPFAVYSSVEAHSSIEKAVKIAGLGRRALRKIEVDEKFAMRPEALDAAIERDRAEGIEPLAVVAALGATGSTAIDPIGPIGEICARRGVWLHVDAAFAGVATLLPECRWMIEGIEAADSYVVNPHKWLLTNFDCTAYYVRDPEALIRTFEILPEYLKGDAGRRVNDYRDWGIPLGRRFRALKLWFVMRTYGAEGLRAHLRNGIQLAEWLEGEIAASKDFEPLVPRSLSHLCFRHHPGGVDDLNALNDWNARLLERLNATGRIYLTHTKLAGAYAIRLVVGQRLTTERHAREAWELIQKTAKEMK